MSILHQISKRAVCEVVSEGDLTTYRFDTRILVGDYTLIEVPTQFASEETARFEFFKLLTTMEF